MSHLHNGIVFLIIIFNNKYGTDAEFVGNVVRIYLETVKQHKLTCQVFQKGNNSNNTQSFSWTKRQKAVCF